jgi:hypothetical protein
MHLKFLAISDTHVGESNSLLSFPIGRQELWYSIREYLGDGSTIDNKIEIDELILNGDIPDRTLSSTSEIQTQTGALIRTLLSAAKVGRLVYVIGNHDHSLWTGLNPDSANPEQGWAITPKADGINIINPDPKLMVNQNPKVEDLLSIFFEYPYGTVWNDIGEGFKRGDKFEFVLANPMYARHFNNRIYAFTHGTCFRPDVCSRNFQRALAAGGPFADLNIIIGEDVTGTRDLAEYESKIYEFVDSIWPSAENNPRTKADQVWYVRRLIRFQQECPRERPQKTELIPWEQLKDAPERIEPLVCQVQSSSDVRLQKGNLDLWHQYFPKPMKKYLTDNFGPLNTFEGITFVYGDTHEGGWGNIGLKLSNDEIVAPPGPRVSGSDVIDIRIANTGGWIVESKERHPACHLFAVDDSGAEYMLDISYRDIKIGKELLLDIAERDYEHRLYRIADAIDSIDNWFHDLRDYLSQSNCHDGNTGSLRTRS